MKVKGTIRWFDFLSQEGIASLDELGGTYINNDPCHGYLCNGGEFGGLFRPDEQRIIGKPFFLEHGDYVECEVVDNQVSKLRLLSTTEIENYLSDRMLKALESGSDTEIWCATHDIINCRETWTYRGMLIHLVPGPIITETRIRSLKTTTKKSYLYADLPEWMRAMLSGRARRRV